MEFKPEKELEVIVKEKPVKVFYFSHSQDKPIALVLHGLRNDTRKVYPLIHLLEPHYSVVAFDFPGYGESRDVAEDYENYIEYGTEVVLEIIKQLNLKTEKMLMLGGSYGSNVIINTLLTHPEIKIRKAGLIAPLFSEDTLSMGPKMKRSILRLAKSMAKGKLVTKIGQFIVNNDTLFEFLVRRTMEGPHTREMLDHEKRLWRICDMKTWGRSVMDLLLMDNSKFLDMRVTDLDAVFVYPRKDQYLEVSEVTEKYKQIFPNAKFEYFESETHMPKGEFQKDLAFMERMKNLIEENLV